MSTNQSLIRLVFVFATKKWAGAVPADGPDIFIVGEMKEPNDFCVLVSALLLPLLIMA